MSTITASQVFRQMLIHAIKGKGFASTQDADDLYKQRLTYIDGGNNPVYVWDEDRLNQMPDEDLQALYARDLNIVDAPQEDEPTILLVT